MAPPASSQFSQTTVTDYLFSFENGVNSGVSPLLLEKNELAWGSNLTTRGNLIHPRPVRRNLTLNFPSQAVQTAVTKGLFQGYCYYRPDAGVETLVASISGPIHSRLQPFNAGLSKQRTTFFGMMGLACRCFSMELQQPEAWVSLIQIPCLRF